MIGDDIKDFAFSLGRAQEMAIKAAHDARQPEIDRLKAVIKMLLPYAAPNDVDLHKPDCRCPYHQGAAAVRVSNSVTPDPRDPDPTKEGIFRDHNCWRCNDGEKPCVNGHPHQCEYPHARND